MSAPYLPRLKSGDSWSLVCVYAEAGVPTSITGMTIRSQLRTAAGGLIAEMVITPDPDQVTNPGKFTLSPVDPDTNDWPVGAHEIDIEVTAGGVIRSTETVILPVIRGVTR